MTDLIYAALLINNFSSNNKNQLFNAVRKPFFSLSYKDDKTDTTLIAIC